MSNKITWTASNNSGFMNGSREASSIAAAVRAARAYIRGELYGEGRATIFSDGDPVREMREADGDGSVIEWEISHYEII